MECGVTAVIKIKPKEQKMRVCVYIKVFKPSGPA
jgi:hypothetical protein